MRKTAVSRDEIYARLAKSFAEYGKSQDLAKALRENHLNLDIYRRLSVDAGLLQKTSPEGKRSVYQAPDPTTQEGQDTIEVMALWLEENGFTAKTKNKKIILGSRGKEHKSKIKEVTPPNFIPPTASENIIRWATFILLEAEAPLPKGSVPAGFVRELHQKDMKIEALTREINDLREKMKVFDEFTDKVTKLNKKETES